MAETYWVTFLIGAGGDREQRYEAVLEAVRHATSSIMCTDFDHFLAFDSDETIEAIAERIEAAFDPATDLALLAKSAAAEARIVGALGDPLILELMPYIRQGTAQA
jgi:hypothetical protein